MSSKENSLLNQISNHRKQKQSEPLSWESERENHKKNIKQVMPPWKEKKKKKKLHL